MRPHGQITPCSARLVRTIARSTSRDRRGRALTSNEADRGGPFARHGVHVRETAAFEQHHRIVPRERCATSAHGPKIGQRRRKASGAAYLPRMSQPPGRKLRATHDESGQIPALAQQLEPIWGFLVPPTRPPRHRRGTSRRVAGTPLVAPNDPIEDALNRRRSLQCIPADLVRPG
jgi:hypothetical protein